MPDYYNKAFQGSPKIGSKPRLKISGNIGGKVATGNSWMGGFGKFVLDPFGTGYMGSEDKPKTYEFLNYYHARVGHLQQKAEAETNPMLKAKLEEKINKSKGAVEKYAYKIDKKHRPGGKFLPPRTFDEIDSGRKSYVEKMAALEKSGPLGSTRTVKRSL
jgi:hypothetical protein